MLKLYMAGLLSKTKPRSVEEHLREELLLVVTGQQIDAGLEQDLLLLQNTFPHGLVKEELLTKMMQRARLLAVFAEGDITAMAAQRRDTDALADVVEVWRALHASGIV